MSNPLEHSFPTKSEFWGIRCEAGKRYSQVVKKPFHLTMAALDPEVRGQSKYISLMVERGERQYLLCNLKHDSILQVNLNLFFDVGERVTFCLKGEATVHLSGYHILSPNMAKENSKAVAKSAAGATLNDIDLDDTSDDDDFDFEDICGNDLESEDEEDSEDDDEEDEGDEEDEDGDEEDEDEEEDSDEEEKSASPKNVQLTKSTPKKRKLEEEDSDDSTDDDSIEELETIQDNKKSKKQKFGNISTPNQNNKVKNTPNKKKVFDEDFDDTPKGKKNPFIDDLNSSIGRTPMPKKSVSFRETPGSKNLNKETPLKKEKQEGQNNQSLEATNVQNSPLTPESKKKKKKRKSKGAMDESGSPKLNESAAAKTPSKLPGGVEWEDLRVGHGLEAKKGKCVHMYYTGKLDSGKVFDATQPGSKPFSFKLGSGDVIKGLDLATQGMKVGGKRKIRIPPGMGYKNQRMGDIPPSSTLNFVVELKAVS